MYRWAERTSMRTVMCWSKVTCFRYVCAGQVQQRTRDEPRRRSACLPGARSSGSAFSSRVVGDAPVHHGQLHRHRVDLFGRYGEQVLGEDGQVGVLARLERAGYILQA